MAIISSITTDVVMRRIIYSCLLPKGKPHRAGSHSYYGEELIGPAQLHSYYAPEFQANSAQATVEINKTESCIPFLSTRLGKNEILRLHFCEVCILITTK